MRIRIGQKVLLTMLAVAVPSLLLFSILTIQSHGAILRQSIIRQLDELSTLSVVAVDDMVETAKGSLLTIADNPELAELIRRRTVGDRHGVAEMLPRLEQTFLALQRLDKTIQAVRFIDAEGYVMAKIREGEILPRQGPVIPGLGLASVGRQADRDFFVNAVRLKKGEIWTSNLERGWLEGEEYWCPAMVRFATPVFTANGTLAGVVIINVWGEEIGKMINRLIPPEEGFAFLVERNPADESRHGIYLFHPNRQCEFGNQTGSMIKVFQDYPPALTNGWMTQEHGEFDHPDSQDFLIHRFYSPYHEGDRGWVVVIDAKREVLMAPLAAMKRKVLLLAGLVLALTIAAALFFSRTITRPLRRVIDGTQRLSHDLASRIVVSSRDEIGLLARNINEMAATIENNLEEKRRAEEQICRSEKLASIGEMAAGVAHELNTPLSNIRALAVLARKDLVAEDSQPPAVDEDLGDIIGQTEKCSKIISGLLSFARKQQSEFALCDVNQLLKNAIALVRIPAEKRQVRIDFLRNDTLPLIWADGHQIEQVCVNLLLNAVDAVDEGGEIAVRLEGTATEVVLRFADNGQGIKPELLSKIFDPFFTSKEVGKGTGLGLSVSYGIVKNHGGIIEVESRVGEGSVFSVTLPVSKEEGHEA